MLPDQDICQVSQAQGENLGCKPPGKHGPSGDLYGGNGVILPEKLRFACLVVGRNEKI